MLKKNWKNLKNNDFSKNNKKYYVNKENSINRNEKWKKKISF